MENLARNSGFWKFRKAEKLRGLDVNVGGDFRIKSFKPSGGNSLDAVKGPGKLSSQSSGGVGVAAPVDYTHQTFFKAAGVEKTVEDRLHRIHNIATGVTGPGFEAEGGMPGNQVTGDLIAGGLPAFEQKPPGHAGKRSGGSVRFRMIVGDARLFNAPLNKEFVAFQGNKHGWEIAHGRAITPIFLSEWDTQTSI